MNTPKLRYLQDLERDDFALDSAQKHAIDVLDELHHQLVSIHTPQVWRFKQAAAEILSDT